MLLTRYQAGTCLTASFDGRTTTSSSYGVRFATTTTATTISTIKITFWIATPSLVFDTPTTVAGWTKPTYSGATQVVGGVTYYGYTTSYTPTVTAVAGTTIVQFYFSISTCYAQSYAGFTQTQAIVNGEQQSIQTAINPTYV